MAIEEPKDPFKAMDWKNMGSSDVQNEPSTGPMIKKRLPRKIRQIPECYFLPWRSIPPAIAFYGAWIAGGIGAGMLLERMVVSSGSLTSKGSMVTMDITGGGADYCFECVGMASLVHEAFACCRKGWGKTVVVGVDKPGAQLSFSSFEDFTLGRHSLDPSLEVSNQNLIFPSLLNVTWTRNCSWMNLLHTR